MHNLIHNFHILIPSRGKPPLFLGKLSRKLSTLSTMLYMQILQVYIIF